MNTPMDMLDLFTNVMGRPLVRPLTTQCLFVLIALHLAAYVHGQYYISYDGVFDPQYEDLQEVFIGPDELSGALPIGFSFTFFEYTYSDFYVSSNGFITFDPAAGSGYNAQSLPEPMSPNNLIAVGWGSLEPDDLYITYETIGSSPERSLHVDFYLEKYDDGECSGYYLSSQIILRETSNIIEIHTTNWDGDACGVFTTQGIENATGTEAYFDPGRNNNLWNANGDYIAFIPGTFIDIEALSFNPTLCTGLQDIKILIRNLSSIVVDTLHFDWEWAGVPQSAITVYTILAPNALTEITLGQKTIVAGLDYTFKGWSYDPDNEPDNNTANDTLNGVIHAGLTGVKTIGGSSPDYATFDTAITDLLTKGVCDSVIFSVRSGVYNTELDFSHFDFTTGGYAVFTSETGNAEDVVITKEYNSGTTNRLVDLNNVLHLRFRDLSFEVTGTACANVMYLNSYCSEIFITDCIIRGSECSTPVAYGASILLTNGGKNDCVIKNNTITKGSHGIYLVPGISSFCTDIDISNNIIDSCLKYAVLITRTIGLQFNDNTIFCPQAGMQAISLLTSYGNITMSGNLLDIPAAWYGWHITSCGGGSDSMKLYNNMVNIGGSVDQSRALAIENSDGVYLWHNTINSNNSLSNGISLTLNNVTSTDVINNIITNLGAGRAAVFAGMTSDYNAYYSINTPLLTSGSTNYNTLGEWQTDSGMDLNSLFADPGYVSTSDLHAQNILLDNAGTSLTPAIIIDIDGEPRNTITPCIGADEFGPGASGNWPGGAFVYVHADATGLNDGTSWTDAFNELTDAIGIAGQYENVQEIWVAEGVYSPHPTRRDTSFILKDSIKIYGGFLGTEANRSERTDSVELVQLSGDINIVDTHTDNSYHVVLLSPQCVECVIDGLTINFGYADVPANSNNIGAGLRAQGGAVITNVIFEHNYASGSGAAIYASGNFANLILSECILRMNTSDLGIHVMNVSGALIVFDGNNLIETED